MRCTTNLIRLNITECLGELTSHLDCRQGLSLLGQRARRNVISNTLYRRAKYGGHMAGVWPFGVPGDKVTGTGLSCQYRLLRHALWGTYPVFPLGD